MPRYGIERIKEEIDHLKNRAAVRTPYQRNMAYARGITVLVLGSLIWLYIMDPILYAFHKGDAIRTYLYLHNCGCDQKAIALAESGILDETEVDDLNRQHDSYQDYFSSPQRAEQEADKIIHYMNGLYYLRTGQYDLLDRVGKVRYEIFVRFGILPPQRWSFLNPTTS